VPEVDRRKAAEEGPAALETEEMVDRVRVDAIAVAERCLEAIVVQYHTQELVYIQAVYAALEPAMAVSAMTARLRLELVREYVLDH